MYEEFSGWPVGHIGCTLDSLYVQCAPQRRNAQPNFTSDHVDVTTCGRSIDHGACDPIIIAPMEPQPVPNLGLERVHCKHDAQQFLDIDLVIVPQ